LFTQQDMGETRGNWMAIVQKPNLDRKPAKIVKGKVLCKLVIETQDIVTKIYTYLLGKNPYMETCLISYIMELVWKTQTLEKGEPSD
jgi:hypothetical protein